MRILLSILLISILSSVSAQTGRIERSERLQSLIDRYEVKYGNYHGFMGLSPKYRDDAYNYFSVLDSVGLSSKESYDRDRILDLLTEFSTSEPSETKTWWRYFYENPSYLFSLKKKDVWLSINPILYLRGGFENEGSIILQNTRGITLKGALGKKIYFSSSIYENQATFQAYHEARIEQFKTIPGQAFFKPFNFNINNQAFDYLNANGFVGLKVNKFTTLELGHGRNFVGHGIRSLLLSDYATNYLYLRANTRFWRFNYQNLFTELTPYSGALNNGDNLLPKKYMAQHLLSYRLTDRIEIGITETVIFNRENRFELQYLNPIIFYRAVEQFLDSADNIMIGLQGKYNFKDGYQIYGQFILDEFNLNQLRDDWNWFGNTIGAQLGLKTVDFLGIDHLDLQLELNAVRPYVYSHNGKFEDVNISPSNFSHNSQPLAHPLGANFGEFLIHGTYRINNKFNIQPRFIYMVQGIESSNQVDSIGYNIGSNILLDRKNKAGINDQKFLQGQRVNVQLYAMNMSYEVWPEYYIDFNLQYRNSTSNLQAFNNNNIYLGIGIRTNFYEEYRDY